MPSFQYGNSKIDYSLTYMMDKKDVSILVDWVDGVNVIVPNNIEAVQLEGILHKKAPWILKKWLEFTEIEAPPSPKEFLSGEKFTYLGRNYRLKVIKNNNIGQSTLQFKNGCFLAYVPDNLDAKERQEQLTSLFKDWYIAHGEQKVKERLKLYSAKLELYPSSVIVKEQKMRWGSCTKKGVINLNWRLLMAPLRVVDYVIVHELVHLKYADHSSDYWNTVQLVLPDYESRKEWLRINGPTLTF